MNSPTAYTVAKLAARWECSTGVIYRLIDDGKLACFRVGNLIRIRAEEVERFECQTTQSKASGEGSPSSGPETPPNPSRPPVTVDEGPLPPKIARAPRRKLAASGKPQMLAHAM